MPGAKARTIRKLKKPSAARKASYANLRKDIENIPPASSTPPQKAAPRKPQDYKHEYNNSQRKVRHLQTQRSKLKENIERHRIANQEAQNVAARATRAAILANEQAAKLRVELNRQLLESQQVIRESKIDTDILRKANRALKKRVDRAAGVLSRSIARAKQKPTIWHLTQKGMFSVQARKLVRAMADSGCARGKVGPLIVRIGDIFGIKIKKGMSRRTVSRVILEGGVAAKVQLSYEMSKNEG